jgi:hypothetical protein
MTFRRGVIPATGRMRLIVAFGMAIVAFVFCGSRCDRCFRATVGSHSSPEGSAADCRASRCGLN